MNIVQLMERAKADLKSNDIFYHDRVDIIVSLLRVKEVLSFRRLKQNKELHQQVGAAIVHAYDNDYTIDLHSRRMGDLHFAGCSTQLISWLDKMLNVELLYCARTGRTDIKARGALELGELITRYLDQLSSNPQLDAA